MPDAHAIAMDELHGRGDWAGLVRYGMAHWRDEALERALGVVEETKTLPQGDRANVTAFLKRALERPFDLERPVPSLKGKRTRPGDQEALQLLGAFPSIAFGENANEAPPEQRERRLRAGTLDAVAARRVAIELDDLPLAAMVSVLLARSHHALGELEPALQAHKEAVRLYRPLAKQRPNVHRIDLATTLNDLGIVQAELGDPESARASFQEALRELRRLEKRRPNVHRPQLASVLLGLGTVLRSLGDDGDAVRAGHVGRVAGQEVHSSSSRRVAKFPSPVFGSGAGAPLGRGRGPVGARRGGGGGVVGPGWPKTAYPGLYGCSPVGATEGGARPLVGGRRRAPANAKGQARHGLCPNGTKPVQPRVGRLRPPWVPATPPPFLWPQRGHARDPGAPPPRSRKRDAKAIRVESAADSGLRNSPAAAPLRPSSRPVRLALMDVDADWDVALRERFGLAAFRPGQREALEALESGRRLLCVQPTGSGKSLLFQFPAAHQTGLTLVLSPLLALMRDQLGQLRDRFGLAAASINSDQDEGANREARDAAAKGEIKLLYVAPEQLDDVGRFEFLARLQVDLLVIDEAHCISSWGHDFRPSYRRIVELVRALEQARPDLKVLALTATADARTEADVRSQIQGDQGPEVLTLRRPMDRPNLRLAIVGASGLAQKLVYLRELMPQLKGPALVYCATRERTELAAEYLRDHGHDVPAYHAGLEPSEKARLQRAFLDDAFPAITATNALGMGIDKSNLRAVVHFDVPGSTTAYYQEVGRGGRDGRLALGALLYDPDDAAIHKHFIRSAQPSPEDVKGVLDSVPFNYEGPERALGALAINAASGRHPTIVRVALAELIEQGFVERLSFQGKTVYAATDREGVPDLRRYAALRAAKERQLDLMLSYGRGDAGCLMAALRRDLGDDDAPPCGRCSVCLGRQSSIDLQGPGTAEAAEWLARRPVVLPAAVRAGLAEGLALYDGAIKSGPFRAFMKQRAQDDRPVLDEEAQRGLDDRARALAQRHRFAAVVPLPSRTWAQRESAAESLAAALGVPALLGLLEWREVPPSRQGALLNNDQRKANVSKRMRRAPNQVAPSGGAILLLDDYVGCGATLAEAARALRAVGPSGGPALVPLVVAKVRWRLGTVGMV